MKELLLSTNHTQVASQIGESLPIGREEQVWDVIRREIHTAAEVLNDGRPILFGMYDETRAGGKHVIFAFIDRERNRLVLEIPSGFPLGDDSPIPGGRLPTMLHGLEAATTALQLAHISSGREEISFPDVYFLERRNLGALMENYDDIHFAGIPLVADPPLTNAIILHKQARGEKVNTLKIVAAHYHVLQKVDPRRYGLIRHTTFVVSKNGSPKPSANDEFLIGIHWTDAIRDPDAYSLYHLGRLPSVTEGVSVAGSIIQQYALSELSKPFVAFSFKE